MSDVSFKISPGAPKDVQAIHVVQQALNSFLPDDPEQHQRVLSFLLDKASHGAAVQRQQQAADTIIGIVERAAAAGCPVTIPPEAFGNLN